MKKKIKALLSSAAMAAILLNAMPWSLPARAETVSAVPLCEIDFDSLDIGTTDIPGGVLPNGNPSNMFSVEADDEDIFPSGKILKGSGDGPEIYFNIEEPIIVNGASEEADYFVTAQMRPHKTGSSAMQYKVVFLAENNHSKRVAFLGIQGNQLLFANKPIEGDKWYNYLIRLHVGKTSADTYIAEKMYPIGEAEPQEWDKYANADRIANSYDIYTPVDCVGVKGWLQNGCCLGGFSVYKYDAESAAAYDKLRDDIENISELSDGMNGEQVKELIHEMALKAEEFPGNAGPLLREAIRPLSREMDELTAASEQFTALQESPVTSSSIFDLYRRAEEIKASIANTMFQSVRDELNEEINAWIREKLEPEYRLFTASDDMQYESSSEMNSGEGWNGAWTVDGTAAYNSGLSITGNAERKFSYAVDMAFECEYTFELKDVSLNGSGFTAECGGIRFGAKEDNGIYYPMINDTVGETPLQSGEKYNFILRVNNAADNTCELRVYNQNSIITKIPDVCVAADIANSTSLRIAADGTVFGKISKEMYPVDYAKNTEEDLFSVSAMTADTETALEEKRKAAEELNNAMTFIRTGAIKDYLNVLFEGIADSLKVNDLDILLQKLDSKTTKQDTQTARTLADGITNASLKSKYDALVKKYEEYVQNTVPVIESVGIEGEVKENNGVSAKISISDSVGNGAGYKAEWLLNGSVAGTGDSFSIPKNTSSKKLSLRVTALNEFGKEGVPVTTDSVTIRGTSNGYISGSGGGSGGSSGAKPTIGSGVSKPNNPTSEKDDNHQPEKSDTTPQLKDVSGHWAEKEIRALAERGVVSGVDEEHFMPDNNVTRAEFIKMLAAALCIDPISYNGTFKDVSENDWYAGYVAAASAEKIVSGDDDMNFMPASAVTREQAAVMLIRAYKRYYANVNMADIGPYTDVSKVSDWAYSDMRAAVGAGLIGGKSETELAPQDVTTRAEAAVMLNRLVNCILIND